MRITALFLRFVTPCRGSDFHCVLHPGELHPGNHFRYTRASLHMLQARLACKTCKQDLQLVRVGA